MLWKQHWDVYFTSKWPSLFCQFFKNLSPFLCHFVTCKWLYRWRRHIQVNRFFFSIKNFCRRHCRFTGQQGKGGDHLLFYSTTSTRSRTLRHLFATLHVRWLSCIFKRLCLPDFLLDEIYHLIELPFDWLIDDAMFVCLFDEFILHFCYNDLTWETCGFELASTITLLLQPNRLTKCASRFRVLS